MIQNIPKEKILEVVKQGPTFPAKIAKVVGGDTMLIGAILSTLISTGDVKVSTLKIGGSPLYYIPEQESKLEDFLDHLNEKDRKVFALLKEKKVLQDSTQDPLTRVSLRGIKDFAKQLEVESQSQNVLFWRFYAVSGDEAYELAKKSLKAVVPVPVQEQPKPVLAQPSISAPEHSEPIQGAMEGISQHPVLQKTLEGTPDIIQDIQAHEHSHTHKHSIGHEKQHNEIHHEKHESKPKVIKPIKIKIDFFEVIKNHVAQKNLDIISKEKIKKSEYDLILKDHNLNEYIYCKAKDKSTIGEGDLAPALIFAQNKKMPCLFISTGDLSQKASSMIDREFSGLKFEKIIIGAEL